MAAEFRYALAGFENHSYCLDIGFNRRFVCMPNRVKSSFGSFQKTDHQDVEKYDESGSYSLFFTFS